MSFDTVLEVEDEADLQRQYVDRITGQLRSLFPSLLRWNLNIPQNSRLAEEHQILALREVLKMLWFRGIRLSCGIHTVSMSSPYDLLDRSFTSENPLTLTSIHVEGVSVSAHIDNNFPNYVDVHPSVLALLAVIDEMQVQGVHNFDDLRE